MFLPSVTLGNRLRWDGDKAPFYETYYIKFCDPKNEWSFWARYTVNIPHPNTGVAPMAALWAFFKEQNHELVAFKQEFPLVDLDIFHKQSFIQIGESCLSLDGCKGFIFEGNEEVQWELNFEDPTLSVKMFPHSLLYRLPFPKSKFMQPRASTFVTGYLNINGRRINLEHQAAHQAHIWGTAYADNWAWAHCNQFAEDESFSFEGLSAQVELGQKLSPRLGLFYFNFEDRLYPANSMLKWIKNAGYHDQNRWTFCCTSGELKFDGVITRDFRDVIPVMYKGPKLEKRYCHSTMMGDVSIKISKRKKSGWVDYKTLRASKSCAFEVVTSQMVDHVQYLFLDSQE